MSWSNSKLQAKESRDWLKHHIIVLVGVSGSGKTTLSNLLEKEGIQRLVTHTTRTKRPQEANGIDYYFVKRNQFPQSHRLIEKTTYANNLYGLSKDEIDQKLSESSVCFVADVKGAQQIQTFYPEQTIVFWLNINNSLMVKRLTERGDTENLIQSRLHQAFNQAEFSPPDLPHFKLDATACPEALLGFVLGQIMQTKPKKEILT